MVALTERMLNDAAGWQVTKHARALVEAGRVSEANYAAPILKGLVQEGSTPFRAGLKIISASNIENLCTCRASRQLGQICAHSVAVGLQILALKVQALAPPVPAPPIQAKPLPFREGSFADPRWIELHLVVGPNFLVTLERDQLVLGVEAARPNQRILLSALKGDGWVCSARDLGIIRILYQINAGAAPGMITLTRAHFAELLNTLPSFDRLTVARKIVMTVQRDPARLQLEVTEEAGGTISLRTSSLASEYLLLSGRPQWRFFEMTWQQISPTLPGGYEGLLKGPVRIDQQAVNNFRTLELPRLQQLFGQDDTAAITLRHPTAIPEVEVSLEGSFNYLEAVVQFIYGKQIITSTTTSSIATDIVIVEEKKMMRNAPREKAVVDLISTAGFSGPDSLHRFILRGENSILGFLAAGLPRLRNMARVNVGPRLRNLLATVEIVHPKVEIQSSGENWFNLSVEMTSQGGERFSAAEIQRLLQMGRSFQKRPNGKIVLFDTGALDEFQEVLRDCDPQQKQPGLYRLAKVHAGYLQSSFAGHSGIQLEGDSVWQSWTSAQLQPVVRKLPAELEKVLRPYQADGVAWMQFLAGNQLGGILADEMGLGKTLQTLAFIAAGGGPAIVVCPSSLVFNWQREAAKFVPDLRVLVIDGPKRDPLFARIAEADLVITSYALLRRDAEKYRASSFQTLILDEANHIKNPDTQNAQAALRMQATHRFALTGTPVENSVRDVWSLAHFCLPGYLGNREDFRERYEQPIQRGDSPEIQARLAKRLRPIMLRRLKRDVAKELPERLEQVAWCELTAAQKEVYRGLLEAGRRKIDEAAMAKNPGQGRMQALTALLRLRQACCDLRLCGLADVQEDEASAKLDLLDELLQEALDGGHRVLVFSQFVAMLQLISARMKTAEIPFAYLDGSTKNRAAEVDRFQNSDDLPLFLISLKAGGTGLNLSGADTVIHFDPWWNPAVEAQATDRAHRIGQTRVVTAYKLITRGTVEEKILALQERKRSVIDATIESEEPTFGALSMDEIRDLMA